MFAIIISTLFHVIVTFVIRVVSQWITLEEAKHGLVHLRLSWLTMSADPKDLQAVRLWHMADLGDNLILPLHCRP